VTAFTFGADNDKGHCISKTFDKWMRQYLRHFLIECHLT
jgi:hypothetical protein